VLSYALFALPGPGDAVIRTTQAAGCPPALLVVAAPDDFSASPLPRVVARETDIPRALNDSGIEAIVVAGWEERIPEHVYAACRHGGWNIHPSLLPAYRGHNPYFRVIRDGLTETGVTIHALSPRLDAGPILLQKRISLQPDETLGSLWAKLAQLGADALLEALPRIGSNDCVLEAQPAGDFPMARKVQPDDLLIRSSMTVKEALRLVRAANPFYGAFFAWRGRMLKVFEAEALPSLEATDSLREKLPANAARSDDGPVIELVDGRIVATVLDLEGVGIVSGRRALAGLR
jgi:methionyl-tRNA formyltransferase